MVSERTVRFAVNAVAFVFLNSLLAGWLETSIALSMLGVTASAFVASVGIFAALDTAEALLGGETPTFGEGSRLYAVRGLLVLYLLIVVLAGVAELLRTTTRLSDTTVVVTAFVVAVVVVFGPLVGYYYRRSVGATAAA